MKMDGTCTGEHGIGLGKKESLLQELGAETIDVMRTIELSVDPHYLMNLGKVFDFDFNATKNTPESTGASTLAKPK